MLDPQQVIVYRSRSEQAFDQLVWEYPEIVLAVAAVLVTTVVLYFAVTYVLGRRRR